MIINALSRRFSLLVFVLSFLAALGVDAGIRYLRPRVYNSRSRVHVYEQSAFRRLVGFAESEAMVKCVVGSMTADLKTAFWAPYASEGEPGDALVERKLLQNRVVKSKNERAIIDVIYSHPDPKISEEMARLFAGEFPIYAARREIDDRAAKVDALSKILAQQKSIVQRADAALSAYRLTHNINGDDGAQNDETYMALSDASREAQGTLDLLNGKMRYLGMGPGMQITPVRIVGEPVTSSGGIVWHDFIRLDLVWVLGCSVVVTLLWGRVSKHSQSGSGDSTAALGKSGRKWSGPIRGGEAVILVLVSGGLLIVGIIHVLSQPRIYQSRIILGFSDDIKKRGWNELSLAELADWMPFIVQQVSLNFQNEDKLKRLIDADVEMRAVGADAYDVIWQRTGVVLNPQTRMMELSFRHPDFQVAGEVATWLGEGYENYLTNLARFDPESFQQRFPQRARRIEPVRGNLERWNEAVTDAEVSLEVFKKSAGQTSNESSEYRYWVRSVAETRLERSKAYERLNSAFREQPVRIVGNSGWAPTDSYLKAPISLQVVLVILGSAMSGFLSMLAFRLFARCSFCAKSPVA